MRRSAITRIHTGHKRNETNDISTKKATNNNSNINTNPFWASQCPQNDLPRGVINGNTYTV